MGKLSVTVCAVVLVTLAMALVPPRSAAVTVTYSVSAEAMVRGTSTGFVNEAQNDGATDTKTEGGTTKNAWLKPTSDITTGWSKSSGCATHFTCVDDDPVHDTNVTIITAPVASETDAFGMADWDAVTNGIVIDVVTPWSWARENATTALTYTFTMSHPPNNCASIVPVLTQAYVNQSTVGFPLNCVGAAWTDANLDALQLGHDSGVGDGLNPITVTATGITVTFRNDFFLDFTSTFSGVTGRNLRLIYECTTSDESSTFDVQIGGSSVGTATCDGGTNGLDLPTFSGSVDVRLVNAPTTGDLTNSPFLFDVLALTSVVEDGGGNQSPRADFTASYVWWEGRVHLTDTSTDTIGNTTYRWLDVTDGVFIGTERNASYDSPFGWLDFGTHEIVVEHTVWDERGSSSTVRKSVLIDNVPRFIVLVTILAVFVVALAMYLSRDKRRARPKPRVVTFNPGKYLKR